MSNKTKYPGVYRLGNRTFKVRAKIVDPRTGKPKEGVRIFENVGVREAVRRRAELIDELRQELAAASARCRVGEYAKSWMRSKALKLDEDTAKRYATALDLHVLPGLGDYYYDALTKRDVQTWVDDQLSGGQTDGKGEFKPWSVRTVHSWFRVFRTMTRDAMEDLELNRDPTMRVSFPEFPEAEESNSITTEQLVKFLDAMRTDFPQHFALAVVLAFTGLRFCHASALRWEDWDEAAGVLLIVRKQVRGRVGPVSRKKRAPNQIPVLLELAAVLREHRAWLAASNAPGYSDGWMFPSKTGTLRATSTMSKAWKRCMTAAGIDKRFTTHGLRYTFTDIIREAEVDPVVRRALTGHVTKKMQHHYSTVRLAEKREAMEAMHRRVSIPGVQIRRARAEKSDAGACSSAGNPSAGGVSASKSGGQSGGRPTNEKRPAALAPLTGRNS